MGSVTFLPRVCAPIRVSTQGGTLCLCCGHHHGPRYLNLTLR